MEWRSISNAVSGLFIGYFNTGLVLGQNACIGGARPKQRGIESVLLLNGAKLMLMKQPLDVGLLDHLVLNVPLILKSSFFFFNFFPFNFLGPFWREGELGDNCFAGSCDSTQVTRPCFGHDREPDEAGGLPLV